MRCAKKSNPDWSVFAPFERRIVDLLSDGVSRSTREVLDAIGARSNCHVRDTLNLLASKGTLTKECAKRDRHYVDCYRLADSRRGRGNGLVSKAVPAKRGRTSVGGLNAR